VWDAGGPHLVLRTSWLYAPWANNFVRTIFKASSQQPSLRVVNDQRGRPTSAEHLANATLRLLDCKLRGTLHVTDGGECTWFEFAQEIVRLSGHACQVDPTTSAEYARPAQRPAYSVLDLGPTEAALGPMPHWRDNLRDVMQRLEPV
jgi:dTDP-4-dehydrorhamnose reductase